MPRTDSKANVLRDAVGSLGARFIYGLTRRSACGASWACERFGLYVDEEDAVRCEH